MKCSYSDDEIINSAKNSFSLAELCRQLGLRPVGGNYRTLKNKIKILNIDTSHFTGQGWNIGLKFKPKSPILLDDILNGKVHYTSSDRLRKRLLSEGIKKYKWRKL